MPQPNWIKPAAPWFHLLSATPSNACDWLWAVERDSKHKVAARMIRGGKSSTAAHFFDEAAAALQFPYYFGENWDAFHDCLADLSWLGADSLVLCIGGADLLFAKSSSDLKKFVEVAQTTAKEWNQPQKSKTPRAIHFVLQVAPGHEAAVKTAWKAAGVELEAIAVPKA